VVSISEKYFGMGFVCGMFGRGLVVEWFYGIFKTGFVSEWVVVVSLTQLLFYSRFVAVFTWLGYSSLIFCNELHWFHIAFLLNLRLLNSINLVHVT